MSEELPAILTEAAASAESPSALGGALRLARENLNMHVEEAARKLCLSSRQLLALEADDIRALPSPAFTRGFIRNYARLLGMNADPLLAVYRDMLPQSAEGAAISLPSEDIPILTGDRKAWMPYILASVFAGLLGGGWLAYQEWLVRQPAPVEVAPVAEPASETPPAPEALPAPTPVNEISPSAVLQLPTTPLDPVVTPSVAKPMLPAKGQLAVSYTQQSWVRVLDRDDKEIFSKTQPAGSEDVIEGNPPFKIEIGNAAGVQLSYNGQPVDLVLHTKANVARFTLE